MSEAVRHRNVLRVEDGAAHRAEDALAAEVALEVRLGGEPFSVIMRTPGADRDLTAGFLFTEGVIDKAADIARLDVHRDGAHVDVTLAPGRAEAIPGLLGTRRQVTMNSSCGMCGRRSLESLAREAPALAEAWTVSSGMLAGLPDSLRAAQDAFATTGGLHAAGLFDRDGRLEASAEDVGRHNAVDKLLGRMLMAGRLPLGNSILFVSGRSSFEIVQKAFLAGIPFVASVSAPSSLAVDLAAESGLTLAGFVRDRRFNVYTHPARVATGTPVA
jgi:FdhD protein